MTEAESSGQDKNRSFRLRWVLLPMVLAIALLAVDALYFLNTPPSSQSVQVVVELPAGMSLSGLSQLLENRGVVLSAERFSWLVRFKKASRQIKAGEYRLTTALRPSELLDKLVRGEVLLHQITFPEGFTLKQMGSLLQARNLASADEFIAAATDPGFVHEFGIPAPSLEGYLFPDTYRFALGLSARTISRSMVTRFFQHFGAAQQEQARQLNLTRHQVVTLASIVERETSVGAERPLIAGVFFNRLRRKIRLQSDPTVIYGIKDFDGNITRKHLQTDTPYNTYTRPGLPLGPICNPGEASIQAVLNPTSSSYLYFVAKKDGTHHFSKRLAEHNAAVLRYQKRRR